MFTRTLRVALIEDHIAHGDKQQNMAQLRRNLLNIPEDTDLVVLPELFSTGFVNDPEQALELAERSTGETMRELKRLSAQHSVAFAGSFLARTAGQVYNRGFFLEPNDDETFYDKRHLFTMSGEQEVYNPGTKAAPVVRFRGFNIKLVICYDLRFPVFCRNKKNDYDMLLVVANWPKARENAWRQLLIARAIENQCYVCGANRCGTDDKGLEYSEGSSLVVDFKGKIIAQRASSPIIAADLSPADLSRFRDKFPVWQDADAFTLL